MSKTAAASPSMAESRSPNQTYSDELPEHGRPQRKRKSERCTRRMLRSRFQGFQGTLIRVLDNSAFSGSGHPGVLGFGGTMWVCTRSLGVIGYSPNRDIWAKYPGRNDLTRLQPWRKNPVFVSTRRHQAVGWLGCEEDKNATSKEPSGSCKPGVPSYGLSLRVQRTQIWSM